MFVTPVPEESAPRDVAAMYDADRERWGFLPNFTQVFSHHPEAYAGWMHLITAVRRNMDLRRCELATLAAAKAIGTTYCSIAHARMLRQWFDSDTISALVDDPSKAGLDDVDVAIMEFAARVARDPVGVTQDEVDRLRTLGLDDRDVLDVVLAVAARCFFATVIESLGAEVDAALVGSLEDGLVDQLTVGRPVGTAVQDVGP